jgi:hypothetical protein
MLKACILESPLMSKLVTVGFTNYYSSTQPVVQVRIVKYDNNKYVDVLKPDGTPDQIKRGYIFADVAMSRPIAEVNWFIHGGGRRKHYKPHVRRTRHLVIVQGKNWRHEFKAKADALRFASLSAVRSEVEVELIIAHVSESPSKFEEKTFAVVICFPSGNAVQEGASDDRRTAMKYLRGYGKRVR